MSGVNWPVNWVSVPPNKSHYIGVTEFKKNYVIVYLCMEYVYIIVMLASLASS